MIINGTANPDELFGNINDQVFGLEGNDTLDAEAGQGSNTLDGGLVTINFMETLKTLSKVVLAKTAYMLLGLEAQIAWMGEMTTMSLFIVEGNNNTLEGALGDDQLWIIEGSLNFLRGGDGNDSLYAGKKGGKFTGGAGNDIFDLTSQGVPDVPVEVLDFTKGEDKIQITTIPEVKSFQDLKIEQILVNGQPAQIR